MIHWGFIGVNANNIDDELILFFSFFLNFKFLPGELIIFCSFIPNFKFLPDENFIFIFSWSVLLFLEPSDFNYSVIVHSITMYVPIFHYPFFSVSSFWFLHPFRYWVVFQNNFLNTFISYNYLVIYSLSHFLTL